MKKVLVLALIAVFVLGMSSCGKKKEEEKSNTEKISNSKGWELVSATVDPTIQLESGEETHDWFGKYMYESEQDDYLVFAQNGGLTIYPGKKLAGETEDGYIESKASTWNFNSDETKLTFQIPFFYEPVVGAPSRTFSTKFETADISKLTETEMVLIYKTHLNFAKDDVEYTFTITYKAK